MDAPLPSLNELLADGEEIAGTNWPCGCTSVTIYKNGVMQSHDETACAEHHQQAVDVIRKRLTNESPL